MSGAVFCTAGGVQKLSGAVFCTAGGVQKLSGAVFYLVPTLCVGMQIGRFTSRLCCSPVTGRKASGRHSHAKRGNERKCQQNLMLCQVCFCELISELLS